MQCKHAPKPAPLPPCLLHHAPPHITRPPPGPDTFCLPLAWSVGSRCCAVEEDGLNPCANPGFPIGMHTALVYSRRQFPCECTIHQVFCNVSQVVYTGPFDAVLASPPVPGGGGQVLHSTAVFQQSEFPFCPPLQKRLSLASDGRRYSSILEEVPQTGRSYRPTYPPAPGLVFLHVH